MIIKKIIKTLLILFMFHQTVRCDGMQDFIMKYPKSIQCSGLIAGIGVGMCLDYYAEKKAIDHVSYYAHAVPLAGMLFFVMLDTEVQNKAALSDDVVALNFLGNLSCGAAFTLVFLAVCKFCVDDSQNCYFRGNSDQPPAYQPPPQPPWQ